MKTLFQLPSADDEDENNDDDEVVLLTHEEQMSSRIESADGQTHDLTDDVKILNPFADAEGGYHDDSDEDLLAWSLFVIVFNCLNVVSNVYKMWLFISIKDISSFLDKFVLTVIQRWLFKYNVTCVIWHLSIPTSSFNRHI